MKKRVLRMREKILLFCLIIALSALVMQTVLYGRTSSTLIYREAKEEHLRILENMQDDILNYMKSVENNLLEIYNQKEFVDDLRRDMDVETLSYNYSVKEKRQQPQLS